MQDLILTIIEVGSILHSTFDALLIRFLQRFWGAFKVSFSTLFGRFRQRMKKPIVLSTEWDNP